jgi:hypothetical protein
MALLLAAAFYAAAAVAGYAVELIFGALGGIPDRGGAHMSSGAITWNHTTWLNIAFLALAAVLVVRFVRSGGGAMLAMMGGAPDDHADHGGHEHHHG